jgi:hypothetical protein
MQRRVIVKAGFAAVIALALVAVAAYASGAPWFKWKNSVDGSIICAQVSPGKAWFKYQGPFMESRCKKHGNPQ